MVRQQKGFTIIELVVVIVILGILAAVAFPKFQDLSGSAKTAVLNSGVAAFKSAAVITLAKNSGTVPGFASVNAQTTADNVTFTGPCPTVTASYTPDTTVSATFTLDVLVCNGS
jgi:MSHA pilin protein MshA